jgi:DNA-binding transcriptional regulator YiaG
MPGVSPSELHELRAAREWAASGAAQAIREAAGLSLNELARGISVSPSTVLRWERGEHRPRGAGGVRYARLLRELMRPPAGNGRRA